MSMKLVAVQKANGVEDTDWSPVGNSITSLAGDLFGLTTGGLLKRLGSGDLTSGGGIWGVGINDFTSDSSGNLVAPSPPSGVNPGVPARLAMPSYGMRVPPAAPISGVYRGQGMVWTGAFTNIFIQRQKQGTRINGSVINKKCDLVWNSVTSQWEVDVSATSVNCIVISDIQFPNYKDNTQLWDSASFATDTYGAWVAFQVTPAFYAQALGLRY